MDSRHQTRRLTPRRPGPGNVDDMVWRGPAHHRIAAKTASHKHASIWTPRVLLIGGLSMIALTAGWIGGMRLYDVYERRQAQLAATIVTNIVVDRIIRAESGGDANAKNKRSTASGAGQFLEGTWLDMIRAYRPDLADRSAQEKLDLRFDAGIAREMTQRFVARNAATLAARGLPVTPGTIYLSHFAGAAGAVALLTAPDHGDAATVMALADSTGRTTREMLVKANPFLETFTVADMKRWGDRKMRPQLASGTPARAANAHRADARKPVVAPKAKAASPAPRMTRKPAESGQSATELAKAALKRLDAKNGKAPHAPAATLKVVDSHDAGTATR